jgi:1-acyl-sn-glycerol-3-phosphate acyltransferase
MIRSSTTNILEPENTFIKLIYWFVALYGLLVFVATMFIFFPFYLTCYLIKEPASAKWHRQISRVWMTVYLNMIGCPLKVKGKQYFQKGQNYVVVCNHNSLMDVPVTTPFMPNANKTIGKKSFAYTPFFGPIYMAGCILIDRKSEKSRKESFRKMQRALSIGLDMVIYPEGTRNRTGDPLKSFYDGAFKLAVAANKPIMPALLFNTKKILPPGKGFYLNPHKIEMHLLPAISSENISSKDLKEKVFRVMWDYYEANS